MKTNILSIGLILSLLFFSDCNFGIDDSTTNDNSLFDGIDFFCEGCIGYGLYYYNIKDTLEIVTVEVDTIVENSSDSVVIEFELSTSNDVRIIELWLALDLIEDTSKHEDDKLYQYYNFTDINCLRKDYDDIDKIPLYAYKDSTYQMCAALPGITREKNYEGHFVIYGIKQNDEENRVALIGQTDFEFSI